MMGRLGRLVRRVLSGEFESRKDEAMLLRCGDGRILFSEEQIGNTGKLRSRQSEERS